MAGTVNKDDAEKPSHNDVTAKAMIGHRFCAPARTERCAGEGKGSSLYILHLLSYSEAGLN